MYYIRYVRNGKRFTKLVYGWDAFATLFEKLTQRGIDASDWGTV